MAEENKFKVDAIKELYAFARSVDNPELKKFALDFADHLAPMDDAQAKKTIYATFTQGNTISRGILRTIISVLPENIVIHRLTGDGNKKELIAPKWSGDKRRVLNLINHELKVRNIIQGCSAKGK